MKFLLVLRRHWFLSALLAVLAVGSYYPEQFLPWTDRLPRDWIIGSVMLATALSLSPPTSLPAAGYLPPVALAVVMQWCWIPLWAWAGSQFLQAELALGLVITAAVPCTLVSAVVWTRLAGGNAAVSLLVTLATNVCCFLVTPALLQLAAVEVISLSYQQIARKLLLLIVVPIGLAQVVRRGRILEHWIGNSKTALGVYAQLGLLLIVWAGAVQCGLQLQQLQPSWERGGAQLVLMCVLVAVLHGTACLSGYWLAGRCGIARPEQIAVAFAGSQKTLMVGMAIVLPIGGLTILPLVAYHTLQLVLDTLLVQHLARREDAA